jgi:hypothetical protein
MQPFIHLPIYLRGVHELSNVLNTVWWNTLACVGNTVKHLTDENEQRTYVRDK